MRRHALPSRGRSWLLCAAIAAMLPAAAVAETATPPLLRAADVLDSIGVNLHIAYSDTSYAAVDRVRAALAYAGIGHVRNLLQSNVGEPAAAVHLEAFARTSTVRFAFVATDPDLKRAGKWLNGFATRFPGRIAAVEGPNEVDHWPIGYAGLSGREAAVRYQRDLYALVHADRALAGTVVYGATGLAGSGAEDLSAIMDFGNEHPYARNGAPPSGHLLLEIEGTHRAIAPSRPMVITETGYPTLVGHPEISFGRDGVSEDVQARYLLDLLLDFRKAGVARTYLYELMDEKPDPAGRSIEQHYGIFNGDGTPKKAATALRNLTALLKDDGRGAATFEPAPLDVTVAGLPPSGAAMTLAKEDGSYQVVVWAEPRIWDAAASRPIAPETHEVDVALEGPARALAVHDPLVGPASLAPPVVARHIAVQVTDHPVVVEVRPASP